MPKRRASCSCGQLSLSCEGEPVRISMCHCIACQKRTGSAFGVQARFPRERVSEVEGRSSSYSRKADSRNTVTFHFCPDCGATVFWEMSGFPDLLAVAVGAFGDPDFPAPRISVYEGKRHPWALSAADLAMEHVD